MKKFLPFFIVLLFASSAFAQYPARRYQRNTFAQLGTAADGDVRYCTNCTQATTCASGGTGAVAQRINGAWSCTSGADVSLSSVEVTDALGYTPVPNTRTVNGHALSANVTVSKSDVGLGSVDNTSDAGKPVSTAQQTALDLKANLISPSLTTPTLGVASATSINKVAITAPATSATLTIANGKTLTVSNSLTLAGTDSTTHTFPSTTSTLARTDAGQTFQGSQRFGTGEIFVGNVGGVQTVGLGSTGQFTWNGNTDGSGKDTALGRNAAGVLEVNNGTNGTYRDLRLRSMVAGSTTARPTCDSTTRGTFYHFYGGASVKDTVDVCAKDASDVYAWRPIY